MTTLGESGWQTSLQLWRIKKGLQEPSGSTPVTDFGHVFEPVMAEKFTQITGFRTRNMSNSYTCSRHPFLRAHIDRQIVSNPKHKTTGLLELKTTISFRLKNLNEPFPIEWKYQIQFYLGLTGFEYAYLFIYERDTAKYHDPVLIKRDEKFIGEIIDKAASWWKRHIVGGIRPDPINDEDRMILCPEASENSVVEATPKCFGFYTEILDIRGRIDRLKSFEDQYMNLIKDHLKNAERIVFAGKDLVTWKNSVSNGLDIARLKADQPELYREYCEPSQTRRFLINQSK